MGGLVVGLSGFTVQKKLTFTSKWKCEKVVAALVDRSPDPAVCALLRCTGTLPRPPATPPRSKRNALLTEPLGTTLKVDQLED